MTKNEIFTFGCRLNAYESEVMRNHVETSGLQNTAVFNTCAVTKEAERQAKQAIRKYHRENPKAKIIVTGCGAQINPDSYANIDGVNAVIGNDEKLQESSYKSLVTDSEQILVNDIMSVTETAAHLIEGLEGHARAFMQVQNGCNHRCTFCIIPYGRGNSRSVPMGEIVSQTKLLVQRGYREVVLTGVDISSYGEDLPGTPTLGQMVKRLLSNVPELPRLRLSSIDLAEIDEDLLEVMATNERFMPYLHLSLQAGDNMILKRMKRRHTREQAIELCNRVREIRPDVTFGADIIAGFPTETDEMFENTLAIVEEAGLHWLHIFPYSEREGTPAANIPQAKQVPVSLRKERAKRLRIAGEASVAKLLQTRIGKSERVVVEKNNMGHTEQFCPIKLEGDYQEGQLIDVEVKDADTQFLYA